MDKKEIKTPSDDDLVGLFAKHLVPILFTFGKESLLDNALMTSFVLSVDEQWFLATAGHSIRTVEEIIASGWQIVECYLIDSMGLEAKHRDPIPFTYINSYPTQLSEDRSFDYGVIPLSLYYRKLLEKNNIQPLNEEVWKCQPTDVDFYSLLGVPWELVKVDPGQVEIVSTLQRVEPVEERPQGFPETDAPMFYGRIELEPGRTSIKGMSGGPIFGFYSDAQGQLRYWLIALQSHYLPNSRYIAACPTKVLGDFLEAALHRYSELNSVT
jgi:hypothetical protein